MSNISRRGLFGSLAALIAIAFLPAQARRNPLVCPNFDSHKQISEWTGVIWTDSKGNESRGWVPTDSEFGDMVRDGGAVLVCAAKGGAR